MKILQSHRCLSDFSPFFLSRAYQLIPKYFLTVFHRVIHLEEIAGVLQI